MTREDDIAEALAKSKSLANSPENNDLVYLLAENRRLRGLAVPAEVDVTAIRARHFPLRWNLEGLVSCDVHALIAEVERLRQLAGLLLSDNPDDRVTACRWETARECAGMLHNKGKELLFRQPSERGDGHAAAELHNARDVIRRRFGLPEDQR